MSQNVDAHGRNIHRLGREWTTILLTVITVASTSCRHRGDPPAPVLLFDGTGTSRGDVAEVESLLSEIGPA